MFDFSITQIPRTRNQLLNVVNQEDVFTSHFGNWRIGKTYNSVLRKDRNPSVSFYYGINGILYHHDFATGQKLDCIAFVQYKNCLSSYKDAIEFIYKDLKSISTVIPIVQRTRTKQQIQFVAGLQESHLEYWFDYLKEKEANVVSVLQKENILPVKELYVNKNQVEVDNCTFAYVEVYKGNKYIKIYSPKSTTQKWLSSIPNNVPFGLGTLKPSSENLIISKSKKDIVVLKHLVNGNADVIGTQNESTSAIQPDHMKQLKMIYKNIYLFWDSDKTGVKNAGEMATMYNIQPVITPITALPLIKDPSDFVFHKSYNELHDYLKTENVKFI